MLVAEDGRLVGVLDGEGKLLPIPPCCQDPIACEKPECWTALGTLEGPR